MSRPQPPDGAAAPPSQPAGRDPLVGELVAGKYRVIELIARGGMGRIYRAEQVPLGRVVALKTLLPQLLGHDARSSIERRFLLEAATCARLSHPNTVTIFDYGTLHVDGDETLFMVMEYVPGRTLAQALRADGPFAPTRIVRIAREIARSLREAHDMGVVHRDLKPSNVMLVDRDDGESVKVLDFGVAKVLQGAAEHLTNTGNFVGSPRYTAPEQVRQDDIDPRADLYALGCVMYELACGQPPFAHGEPMRTMIAHLQEPVPPLAARAPRPIPAGLEAVILRCLEKERERRPAGVAELLHVLRAAEPAIADDERAAAVALADGVGLVRPPSPAASDDDVSLLGPSPARPPRRPWGWLFAAAVAGFIVVGVSSGAAMWGLFGGSDAPSADTRAAAAATMAADAPAPAVFRIRSEPPGARVYEGDALLGTTPLELPAGPRALVLRHDGADDQVLHVLAEARYAVVRFDVPAPSPPAVPAAPAAAPAGPRPKARPKPPPSDDIRTER